MENINYEDFSKIELKVARVLEAERVEGSDKLIRLIVNSGEEGVFDGQTNLPTGQAGLPAGRQVVAGIGKTYEPEALIGKSIIIVANLEPRKLMGLESQGMLLAASDDAEGPILLTTDKPIIPGATVK